MIWHCIIGYLKMLYSSKLEGAIVDYKVTYIDWISGSVDVQITPNQTIEFLKIDGIDFGIEKTLTKEEQAYQEKYWTELI